MRKQDSNNTDINIPRKCTADICVILKLYVRCWKSLSLFLLNFHDDVSRSDKHQRQETHECGTTDQAKEAGCEQENLKDSHIRFR